MDDKGYVKFSETNTGDTLVRPVLVATITEAVTKAGKTYVRFNLKDGYSDVSAQMFDIDKATLENSGVVGGSVADATIGVGEYNGNKSFTVRKIEPCRDGSLTFNDFIKTPPLDAELMFGEIIDILKSSSKSDGSHTPLTELAINILNDNAKQFKTSSAAVSMHHNMKSGLIYHTYRMVKSAMAMCGIYDELDRELLVCGTALHDIGKLWEYSTTEYGEAEVTKKGVLFGHLYMGAMLINKYSSKGSYDPERVMLLTHLLLSHHGTAEFGAVKTPAFAEAFVLYYIDNIDAKIGTCNNYYDTLRPGELTEKKPFGLDNKLYKPNL